MEKITKEYNVYDFNELDKKIQEDLIEKQLESDFEFYCDMCLQEDMGYEAERLLEKYFGDKATFKNVYYSLTYCQGDGAMIEFDLTYYGKYIKVLHEGYYYHYKSFTTESYEYLTDKQYNQLYEKIEKMNRELEKYGWELVDIDNYRKNNEDYIIERLQEDKYLENGERFC